MQMNRRDFIRLGLGTSLAIVTPVSFGKTILHRERSLKFHNIHTGENLKLVYWSDDQYQPESLQKLNHLLRDHRNNKEHSMDPKLFDILHQLQSSVSNHRPFQIISGYRSPETNAMLSKRNPGVAKNSLHMKGEAIDVRLPGTELKHLRNAAIALGGGGVGYYRKNSFIHVDTGRVRSW